ncbi:putative O-SIALOGLYCOPROTEIN ENDOPEPTIDASE [Zalerion maritima]|uniref:N(6)-L-threonylcarbamoyladenine synthase n=1 Tax=Zalerion maritima TaxID=339359 RepID=A0AAD5WN01_9PEZI|nr:putative O-SIALOGLYCOPROTEIN ENDOPEPTIDASE [Zalerion maritima]
MATRHGDPGRKKDAIPGSQLALISDHGGLTQDLRWFMKSATNYTKWSFLVPIELRGNEPFYPTFHCNRLESDESHWTLSTSSPKHGFRVETAARPAQRRTLSVANNHVAPGGLSLPSRSYSSLQALRGAVGGLGVAGRRAKATSIPSASKTATMRRPTTSPRESSRLLSSTPAQRKPDSKPLLVLGIETSCDDTCVSLLTRPSPATATLLHSGKTMSDNTEWGGVVPSVAILSHTAGLAGLVEETLSKLPVASPSVASSDTITIDGTPRIKPDLIAVTRGPGMMANLAVGLNTAKGLALALQRPMVAVNHMQAHALTPRLVSALENTEEGSSAIEKRAVETGARIGFPPSPQEQQPVVEKDDGKVAEQEKNLEMDPSYPYLTLLVSGGHTQLSLSLDPIAHPVLASVKHLALGRMLDHSAREILPPELLTAHSDVMYGRLLETFAFPPENTDEENYGWYEPPAKRSDEIKPGRAGEKWKWTLPVPLADTRRMEYDFTGLRGTITKIVHHEGYIGLPFTEEERRVMAREVMRLCFEHLASRMLFVLDGDVDHTLIEADARNAQEKGSAADWASVSSSPSSSSKKPGTKDNIKTNKDGNSPWGSTIRTIVISGGVASNKFLLHVLREILDARGHRHVRIVAPPAWLCTDNATMIAWTGAKMWEMGWRSDLGVIPLKKWTLDPRAEDKGVLGVGGWVRSTE